MPRVLHVTNGDSTGNTLAQLFPGDRIVVWRDVLHEGPIPTGISDAELREVRAAFLASKGWGAETDVLTQFAERDAALADYGAYDEVVLWFEHDLYDQLQLIQVLDWLPGEAAGQPTISLIWVDAFPGVAPFHGLGQLNDEQLATLFPERKAVTDEQLVVARTAWAAVREPNPSAVERVLPDIDQLPFLNDALRRYLELFPALETGLNRTERQLLDGLATEPKTPAELFAVDQDREERPFLGDLTFFDYLQRLGSGPEPLLQQETGQHIVTISGQGDMPPFLAQRVVATDRGRKTLAGADDWAGGPFDRWIGGVFLQAERPGWRWDPGAQRLRFPD